MYRKERTKFLSLIQGCWFGERTQSSLQKLSVTRVMRQGELASALTLLKPFVFRIFKTFLGHEMVTAPGGGGGGSV